MRVVFSLSQNEPEIFNSQQSNQRWCPWRHHSLAAIGLKAEATQRATPSSHTPAQTSPKLK